VVAVLRLGLSERGVTEIMGVAEHVVSVVAAAEGLRLAPDVPRGAATEGIELIDTHREPPAEARATLAEIAAWSSEELGVARVPAFWRAFAGRPRLLRAIWAKHRLVLGVGELDASAKLAIALAVAMNKRSPYWTGYFAEAGRRTAAFDDDVILEIAGATLHYASFNTISHGMMLDAPHSDIVAAEFSPAASSKAE
jgi:hypothetical protein